jgi:hypothetical protein
MSMIVNKSKRIVSPLTVLAATSAAAMMLFGNAAFAKDYTRSCSANVRFEPTSFRGTSWSYSFSGRGTVGYYAPNTARERAAARINECYHASWDQREHAGRPTQCTESNQVYSYPYSGPIGPLLRINICRLNPGHASMVVKMWVLTDGDTGCFGNINSPWSFVDNYTVNCTGLPLEPNTDRPGMNIRHLDLARAEPDLCRQACEGETGCRAWTYVKPGVQGTSARCWLKNGVPPAQRDDNCTSGVYVVLH